MIRTVYLLIHFIDANRQWINAVLLLSTRCHLHKKPKWNIMTFYKKKRYDISVF